MKLTNNFHLDEFINSDTAKAKKIENIPTAEHIENIKALTERVLQPIRDELKKPIKINSGFRSKELNDAIKGAATSQHMNGEAADITLGTKTANKTLFNAIKKHGEFDQLIDEQNYTWVHVSYKRNGKNRKQILHLK